ncbi:hypothetical protein [Pseudomonas taetrolens]|uniref:hypothetical protein n=1 Tax=Pseudomonas taetrolens TaxID=47884 RepID=UPI0030DAACF1
MDYQAERLGLIVDLAEQSMDIVQRFSNDPIGAGNIQTASGPIKNLKQVSADIKSDGQSAIDTAVTDLIDTLKAETSVSALIDGLTDAASLAEESADRAELAADSANATGKIYDDIATGLLPQNSAPGQYFSVPSADVNEYLILYKNNFGVAEEVGRFASADAVNKVLSMIRPTEGAAIYDLHDELGFVWGEVNVDGFNLPGLTVRPAPSKGLQILDADNFLIMEDTLDRTTLGSMAWCYVPYDGLWQIDELGFLISDLNNVYGSDASSALPKSIPYLAREVCGVDGVELSLYVDGLLEVRSDTDLTRATLAAETKPVIISSSEEVRFIPSELGAAAKLYTRPLRGDASSRTVLDLVVKSAPNPPQGEAPAPKILLFGDSIGNHQGPMLLNQFLTQWGYVPTFIGTYPSSIAEADGWNRLGLPCEARQSWSGNQYSYEDMTRTPIAVGAEAAYLAMTKAGMSGYNPFLRVATGADPVAFVKNGYIFDPAFYQQRFGLEAPTIIINALNTNDFRDQTAADIYNTVYENDILFHTQFRAAWPNAKIIRCMPGAARNSGPDARNRDVLWTSHYIPAIRAMLDARAALADPKISVASSWAFCSPEAGYMLDAGVVDATTGAVTAGLSDWLHPQGSTRRQYYQYLAGHAACAAVNLI